MNQFWRLITGVKVVLHRWYMHVSFMMVTHLSVHWQIVDVKIWCNISTLFVKFQIFLPFARGFDSFIEGLGGRTNARGSVGERRLTKWHGLIVWWNDELLSLPQGLGGGGDGGLTGSIVGHSCSCCAKRGKHLKTEFLNTVFSFSGDWHVHLDLGSSLQVWVVYLHN